MWNRCILRARAIFAVLALTALVPPVWAQASAVRPIRLVVPQPPGGSMDTNARALAEHLARLLGQHVVIENRGGANGIIAGEIVARAAADGHTMLYTSNSFANNQLAYKKLPFNVQRDFAPVTLVATLPGYLVIVNPQVPAQTLGELIELAKNERRPIKYGSGGIGNSQHLLGELLNNRAGTKLLHVPYKGLPLITNALLGNEVQVAFAAPTTVLPHIKADRLRALAYSGAKRWPLMPDLATIAETLPGFVFEAAWHGMFAPAATSAATRARVQVAVATALQSPRLRGLLESGGYVPVASTPSDFVQFLQRYLKDTAEHMRIAGVQPE